MKQIISKQCLSGNLHRYTPEVYVRQGVSGLLFMSSGQSLCCRQEERPAGDCPRTGDWPHSDLRSSAQVAGREKIISETRFDALPGVNTQNSTITKEGGVLINKENHTCYVILMVKYILESDLV